MIQRQTLKKIFQAAIDAVKTDRAITRRLTREGSTLVIDERRYDLNDYKRVVLIGAGKGCAPMASAMQEILGDRLDTAAIVVKYDHGLPVEAVDVLEAGHPLPDENSLNAGRRILDLVTELDSSDLLICLITGGSSALLEALLPGLTFEDLTALNRILLACGASIHEMNVLRKHVSAIKGGRLAQACRATILSLIVSDVIGDDPSVIGSGPTAPDSSRFGDCMEIIERYDLADRLPRRIMNVFRQGASGNITETPDKSNPRFSTVANIVIADNKAALDAAAICAKTCGYNPILHASAIQGEARDVGTDLIRRALELQQEMRPQDSPICLLAGGETTVTMTQAGKGGRNQEMALAMVHALAGHEGVYALCAGTDGTDGPTDAAGAFAFCDSAPRAESLGLDLKKSLTDHNAYPAFRAMGDLLITGPTLTNVMDLILVLIEVRENRHTSIRFASANHSV